jgi:hypothetical protein
LVPRSPRRLAPGGRSCAHHPRRAAAAPHEDRSWLSQTLLSRRENESWTRAIAGCFGSLTLTQCVQRPGTIDAIATLRHQTLKLHIACGLEQVGADLALSSSQSSAAWCRRRAWRPAQAAGQFCLVRCFNMKLQAASASSNVLKGEPPILIAPRL